METSGQFHAPTTLHPSSTLWIGGWVCPEPVWTRWPREKIIPFLPLPGIEPESSRSP